MGARGRKSAASMSIVRGENTDMTTAISRPEPPVELTPEQAEEWRAIVDRMPADWFPRETHGLLIQYVRHVASANKIAELIDSMLVGTNDSEDWLKDYETLLKMQEREGRAMSSLATRMRVSQQAQYNERKSVKTGKPKKPWAK